MQSFLKDAERQKRTNEVLRKLVADLRELVYEAEDILVDCQLEDGDEDDNEQRASNAWLSRFYPARVSLQYKKSKRLKEINERIKTIKTTVEPYFKFRTPSNVGRDNGTDRWSSPVYDHTQVVGLEGDKRNKESLCSELVCISEENGTDRWSSPVYNLRTKGFKRVAFSVLSRPSFISVQEKQASQRDQRANKDDKDYS
ncbi:disease resistance RPP13-like protein 4 [Eutrema salsugineum]|uniref:disease resistance RPP13-like protein 4 n=1 Tax=Eutrema salsugineum TaxID=72664 RepID=UPI000CED369D|nr:disease resistance RPP13-like protein 4 [Eutrema salsugineum]